MITESIVRPDVKCISLHDMSRGSVGITKDGSIYIRGYSDAFCLTNVGNTYGTASRDLMVEQLPKGTKITFVIG